MALNIGQTLKGRNGVYRLIEVLKAPTVFKAQVTSSSTFKADFVVIKDEEGPKKTCLKRERKNYLLPAIASCPNIRKLHDLVELDSGKQSENEEVPMMVFEWMEHDLRTVSSDKFREHSNLPKIIAKSVLSALAILKTEYNAIHTDINPNNVFLSDIQGLQPVVKIGDLGNMVREGYSKIRVQSLATRAPEVWRGLGCWHSSDVWSLGVTLVHWLAPLTIFGAADKIIEGHDEAWCIAKIRRLVGPFGPPIDNPNYEEEFEFAESLETTTFVHPDTKSEERFIKAGTLREEIEKLPGPKVSPELVAFIEYLLVLDPTKRPTAVEALKHPYLQSIP